MLTAAEKMPVSSYSVNVQGDAQGAVKSRLVRWPAKSLAAPKMGTMLPTGGKFVKNVTLTPDELVLLRQAGGGGGGASDGAGDGVGVMLGVLDVDLLAVAEIGRQAPNTPLTSTDGQHSPTSDGKWATKDSGGGGVVAPTCSESGCSAIAIGVSTPTPQGVDMRQKTGALSPVTWITMACLHGELVAHGTASIVSPVRLTYVDDALARTTDLKPPHDATSGALSTNTAPLGSCASTLTTEMVKFITPGPCSPTVTPARPYSQSMHGATNGNTYSCPGISKMEGKAVTGFESSLRAWRRTGLIKGQRGEALRLGGRSICTGDSPTRQSSSLSHALTYAVLSHQVVTFCPKHELTLVIDRPAAATAVSAADAATLQKRIAAARLTTRRKTARARRAADMGGGGGKGSLPHRSNGAQSLRLRQRSDLRSPAYCCNF